MVLLLSPFSSWRDWSSQKWCNLPKWQNQKWTWEESMSFQSLLLCPRSHYDHWRISSSRSTLSSHILHQGRRGNGNISYEKLKPPITPLNGWCLTICGQALTILLPTEATKCPILKRLDKNVVHLVSYQIVPGEPQPRKGCKAPLLLHKY